MEAAEIAGGHIVEPKEPHRIVRSKGILYAEDPITGIRTSKRQLMNRIKVLDGLRRVSIRKKDRPAFHIMEELNEKTKLVQRMDNPDEVITDVETPFGGKLHHLLHLYQLVLHLGK